MDETDISLNKIRRLEAMRTAGWGSLDKEKNCMRLYILTAQIENYLTDMETLHFVVSKLDYTAINGNKTHSIIIDPNGQSTLKESKQLLDEGLVAVVRGKLKSFEFALSMNQLKQMKRHPITTKAPISIRVELLAKTEGDYIKITWKENGRPTFDQIKQQL